MQKHRHYSNDHYAHVFHALGDPTRLSVFCFMKNREQMCVTDIAEALELTVANTSHHLQILYKADLFTKERQGLYICYKRAENTIVQAVEELIQCSCQYDDMASKK